MKLQRLGGYASIVSVCLTIAAMGNIAVALHGMALYDPMSVYDPLKMIAAYQASLLGFWVYYISMILTGMLTLFITLVLQERMHSKAAFQMRLAVIAASIYAALRIASEISGCYRNIVLAATNDNSAFRAFLVLHESLVNAAENVWGWGLLLIGWAGLKTRALPQMLAYFIFANGIAAIFQFIFAVHQIEAGEIINKILGLIVFGWLGAVLLRTQEQNLG
jgi:hypothetical protein